MINPMSAIAPEGMVTLRLWDPMEGQYLPFPDPVRCDFETVGDAAEARREFLSRVRPRELGRHGGDFPFGIHILNDWGLIINPKREIY